MTGAADTANMDGRDDSSLLRHVQLIEGACDGTAGDRVTPCCIWVPHLVMKSHLGLLS